MSYTRHMYYDAQKVATEWTRRTGNPRHNHLIKKEYIPGELASIRLPNLESLNKTRRELEELLHNGSEKERVLETIDKLIAVMQGLINASPAGDFIKSFASLYADVSLMFFKDKKAMQEFMIQHDIVKKTREEKLIFAANDYAMTEYVRLSDNLRKSFLNLTELHGDGKAWQILQQARDVLSFAYPLKEQRQFLLDEANKFFAKEEESFNNPFLTVVYEAVMEDMEPVSIENEIEMLTEDDESPSGRFIIAENIVSTYAKKIDEVWNDVLVMLEIFHDIHVLKADILESQIKDLQERSAAATAQLVASMRRRRPSQKNVATPDGGTAQQQRNKLFSLSNENEKAPSPNTTSLHISRSRR